VNGHDGVFFLHPQLSYARGDFSFAFDPHESQSTLKIDLPTSFLKRGENTIVVACVDLPESSGDPAVSGISYDALSLEQDTTRKFDSKSVTANAEATIFYRQAQTGLSEVVDAFLRFNQPLRAGTAELAINGKRYTANLSTAGDYGEQRVSFEVPEWTGRVNAKLSVRAGERRSFDVTLTPQRKWTIFVVPHTHLDVGYTDYQGKVAEVQPRVLNQAAELIKEHPDFRFSMDGSWNLQQLLDTRSKAKQEEIVNLIREGKMAMPAQYCDRPPSVKRMPHVAASPTQAHAISPTSTPVCRRPRSMTRPVSSGRAKIASTCAISIPMTAAMARQTGATSGSSRAETP